MNKQKVYITSNQYDYNKVKGFSTKRKAIKYIMDDLATFCPLLYAPDPNHHGYINFGIYFDDAPYNSDIIINYLCDQDEETISDILDGYYRYGEVDIE